MKYRCEQRQIAAAIGVHPTNLSRYLDTKRDNPCSLRQVLTMLVRLKDCYARDCTETLEPGPDMHAALSAVQNRLNIIHDLLIEILHRSKDG